MFKIESHKVVQY